MKVYSYKSRPPEVKSTVRKQAKRKKINKLILLWLFRVAAVGLLGIALLFWYYSKDLPDPNKLLARDVPQSTQIYARDGTLLYQISGQVKRTLVNLDQVPTSTQDAVIAVEDKNFYHENGISITGIVRSALVDVFSGSKAQGGSTITQEFVKNAILTNQKSFSRKLKEVIISLEIDARLSKQQILQLYFNEIPWGRNAYGIQAASQTYFGKDAKNLDLAESAYLAAMIQAPTYYNPLGPNRSALDSRKNTVLALMADQGYINSSQEEEAKNEKVTFSPITNSIVAPHFVLWIENYLVQKYGETAIEEGGMQVYTTLDPRLQKIAENVVQAGAAINDKRYNGANAALVAIDPKTGQVLAMVGSKDYFGTSEPAGCAAGKTCTFDPNFNAAVAPRQPGSSFKPYVYVTAFSKPFDYTPATPLYDLVTDFGSYNGKDYVPHNYSGESNGLVNMRKALAGSLNIPAVKTLDLVGVNNAVQTAHNLGITSPLQDCGLSLVLGGCEISLLDHVAAYSVFANGGIKNPETPILKVQDKNGNILEQFQPNPQQELDPQANYELISILTDNNARAFVFGPNSPLILPNRVVAAKTGTTQNWHDGWTIGFTPSLAAGVWVGNNNGALLKQNADGVVVAAPIWHNFMQQALASTTPETFTIPSGIQQVAVDDASGKLPTNLSPSIHTDVFASYSIPTAYDDVHMQLSIDSSTGLPATSLTPPGQIIYKTCSAYHSEMPNNPNWENPVRDWAAQQPDSCPAGFSPSGSPTPTASGSPVGNINVNILSPEDGGTIFQTPFTVTVGAASSNNIARVDLYIDGQLYQSISNAPYVFQINKSLDNGQHTLAATAVDTTGATSDTSISIIFSPQSSAISISNLSDGSSLNFPQTLAAQSAQLYSSVNFYYQASDGTVKLIGPSTNTSHPSELYLYTSSWNAPPPSGNYSIFAQTNTGASSPKIKVIVP